VHEARGEAGRNQVALAASAAASAAAAAEGVVEPAMDGGRGGAAGLARAEEVSAARRGSGSRTGEVDAGRQIAGA